MRPCLDCGTPTEATRCPSCQRAKDRGRNHQRTHYHGDWERRSKQTRDQWVAEHGMTCAGLPGKGMHPATTLQLDHTTGRVLCPTCNVNAGPAGPDAALPHT